MPVLDEIIQEEMFVETKGCCKEHRWSVPYALVEKLEGKVLRYSLHHFSGLLEHQIPAKLIETHPDGIWRRDDKVY